MKRWRKWIALFGVVVLALLIGLLVLNTTNSAGTSRVRPADQLESVNGVEFRHYFTEAAGFTWHHVEYGSGTPIVFVHGIPGAWYSWHHVMANLGANYRTIAIDLKGLGLSDHPEDVSYNAEVVSGEFIQLMDALGVDKFALVGHEWGSVVTSYIAARYPERVTHFVRIETPVSDAAINNLQTLIRLPQIGLTVLGDGEGFVRRMYTGESSSFLMANVPGNVVAQPIAEEDVARIAQEFSYEGIPQAIIHYYQDTPSDLRTVLTELAADTTMPVLLLQGDSDPIQPLSFYDDAAAPFPNATFQAISGSGHVPMLEQPDALAEIIRGFVR